MKKQIPTKLWGNTPNKIDCEYYHPGACKKYTQCIPACTRYRFYEDMDTVDSEDDNLQEIKLKNGGSYYIEKKNG